MPKRFKEKVLENGESNDEPPPDNLCLPILLYNRICDVVYSLATDSGFKSFGDKTHMLAYLDRRSVTLRRYR